MRRWRLWLLVGTATALLFAVVLFYRSIMESPEFTHDQYLAIKEGMTEEQVKGVLGRPPGYYAARPGIPSFTNGPLSDELQHVKSTFREWIGDEGRIGVYFDEHGGAREWEWAAVRPPPEPWFVLVKRWLGW